jgi:hypothetical protein
MFRRPIKPGTGRLRVYSIAGEAAKEISLDFRSLFCFTRGLCLTMAWFEQLDLDFGSIQDQFTDLIGEVALWIFC